MTKKLKKMWVCIFASTILIAPLALTLSYSADNSSNDLDKPRDNNIRMLLINLEIMEIMKFCQAIMKIMMLSLLKRF